MEKKLEIYGARSIIEAINANQNIDKVLLLKSSKSSLTKSLVNLIIKKNISHSFVPIQRFERLKNKNHQGALAFLSPSFSLRAIKAPNKESPSTFVLTKLISGA